MTSSRHIDSPAIFADLTHWLLTKFSGSTSRLTRVHFHTLEFHIIGNVKGISDTDLGSDILVLYIPYLLSCTLDQIINILYPGSDIYPGFIYGFRQVAMFGRGGCFWCDHVLTAGMQFYDGT